jgi:hypothetical protein
MAKTTINAGPGEDSTIEIDLKDRRLAAFLAWLVPGLGHIYQGRTGKGILFSVCILGTFFYGMYIGNGRVVYASTTQVATWKFPFITPKFAERWQYGCQLGVGLAAMPAYVQTWRMENGNGPLFGLDNFERPPRDSRTAPPADLTSQDRTEPDDPNRTVASPDELSKWNYDQGENFEIGTVFTVIAGLLNLLVVFDAYGGPLVIPPPEEKKKEENKDDDKGKKA